MDVCKLKEGFYWAYATKDMTNLTTRKNVRTIFAVVMLHVLGKAPFMRVVRVPQDGRGEPDDVTCNIHRFDIIERIEMPQMPS